MGSIMNYLKRQWFALSSGAICFLWAFAGWLTVIPNQDILADGIQAQSLLSDPRLVLSFPGQKHGGPLEYPATLLAEALAPGNYFANAAIRPLLAFATGALVALLFQTLFSRAPKWAFLASIAVGPTIIHGLLGPAGNTVGVWWLQPNWDMAWLLTTAGSLVLARSLGIIGETKERNDRALVPLAGGILVGLGFFAHPAIIILIIPLLSLVLLRSTFRPRVYTLGILGAFVGVLPAFLSYVLNAGVNTWDPSHGAFISVDYYRTVGGAVLGLNGMSDYMTGLLPYGLGLAPSTFLLNAGVQSAIMWIFVMFVCLFSAASIIRAIIRREPLKVGGAIATAWLVAMGTMLLFITFVDPVWIYGAGLSILFWLSVGTVPMYFKVRWVGFAVTAGVIVIVGLSTFTHNASFYSDFPARIKEKTEVMQNEMMVARALKAAGAEFVFGSYYDAIPIGYASGRDLRTITNHYNRFPLSPEEKERGQLRVAVNTNPNDPWGREALQTVLDLCQPLTTTYSNTLGGYGIFRCPSSAMEF